MGSKDAKALDAFYERYNRFAFSLVYRIVGSREDAEDVLVDVFWQVWQQAARYDPSRGKPIAWLLTIARTPAIDSIRSSPRHPVTMQENSGEAEVRRSAEPDPDPFVMAD